MSDIYPDSHQFTIQQMSERLNIPKPTLRFWEKELEGIFAPLRTPGGQRRYTKTHITILENIKNLRNSGKSIPEIKEFFTDEHDSGESAEAETAIDILTQRIAELVKMEITRFLNTK